MPASMLRRLFAAAAFMSFMTVGQVRADMAEVVAAAYGEFSMAPPTPASVFICHGYGCRYRTEVAFSNADRAKLAQLMAPGKASPEAERRAVAAAGAWFDRRIAPTAGTTNHIARSGYTLKDNAAQFDCIDSSRNSTSLLLVLEQLKLLRHHRVDPPESRGYFVNIQLPHATAVLTDKKSGIAWSIDSWTRAYGQPPEIMPVSVWVTLD
ncbi:MAG: hypothetical protein ABI830_02790 [Pseudolabrys sp.]